MKILYNCYIHQHSTLILINIDISGVQEGMKWGENEERRFHVLKIALGERLSGCLGMSEGYYKNMITAWGNTRFRTMKQLCPVWESVYLIMTVL